MKHTTRDIITPEVAVTLDGLFQERANRSPNAIAYQYYDDVSSDWLEISWYEMTQEISRWQSAMINEGLREGDRVAIMLKNCPKWVIFDQAALGLGLITVPLYTADRPENVAHVLGDSGAKLLLIDSAEHWHPLHEATNELLELKRIVCIKTPPEGDDDNRLRGIDEWLPEHGDQFHHKIKCKDQLATIVYTSGTMGKSKGVMLSHYNLLYDSWASVQTYDVNEGDTLLSLLPLSHTLERMGGYCIPIMVGAKELPTQDRFNNSKKILQRLNQLRSLRFRECLKELNQELKSNWINNLSIRNSYLSSQSILDITYSNTNKKEVVGDLAFYYGQF